MLRNTVQFFLTLVVLMSIMHYNSSALTYDTTRWQLTKAKIQIIRSEEKFETEGTVFGAALEYANKNIEEVQESDKKTIIFFILSYEAPVILKKNTKPVNKVIKQTGFYRTMYPQIQEKIEQIVENGIGEIDVIYDKDDPIAVYFPIDGQIYNPPTLLSDTTDALWEVVE